MKLVPVSCQNCGASLDIPDNARFVTCQFCNTRLAVQHTGSAIFTELLGELSEKTTRMAANLEVIRVQNEIEKLDREWSAEKDSHMIRGKHGRVKEPDAAVSVFGGIFLLLIGASACLSAPQTPFLAIGFLVVIGGVYQIISGPIKAEAYRKAREAYESERRILESRLENRG